MSDDMKSAVAVQDPWETRITPIQLHHIAFKTARFQDMQAFYSVLLGVQSVLDIPNVVGFYTFDLAHHRLVLFNDPTAAKQTSGGPGMHHVAFAYDTIDDLMRMYQRLKTKGILPHFVMNHGPNTAFYYQDPDDNTVELQIDNFGKDLHKGLEAMYALRSSANPFGVMVNPETFLSAWQAGATRSELHQRSYAGDFSAGAAPFPAVGPTRSSV